MKIIISSHQGNLYNDDVDYILVHSSSDGEYTIMSDHVPVISVIDEGYLKLVRDKDEYFVVLVSGILKFNNNEAVVLVQEAHIGQNVESAKEHLLAIRQERINKNRQETVDFTKKENELRQHLKNAGAGSL